MKEFEVLSKAAIFKWLNGLIGKGAGRKLRPGPTLESLGKHMGIDRNTMIWLGRKETARMSIHRQMHFSKVIAQIENGELTFEIQGRTKVAMFHVKPKPIVRYGVSFGAKGPTLQARDRPAPYKPMPTFKDLLLK